MIADCGRLCNAGQFLCIQVAGKFLFLRVPSVVDLVACGNDIVDVLVLIQCNVQRPVPGKSIILGCRIRLTAVLRKLLGG